MTESAAVAAEDFVLKHTPVAQPQVEHTSSAQSITAHEDYQSSLSATSNNSRPVSAASDAQLLDDQARKYSTPPSSPSLVQPLPDIAERADPGTNDHPTGTATIFPPESLQRATRMRPGQYRQPGGTPPDNGSNGGRLRRKPVGTPNSDVSSDNERRVSYPPPRTSVNRSTPSPDADDAPYIRFALDQLTRDEEVRGSRRYPTHDRWSTAPAYGDSRLESSRPTRTVAPNPALYTPYPPVKSPARGFQVAPGTTRAAGEQSYPGALAAAPVRPVNTRGTDGTNDSLPRQTSAGSGYGTPPQEPSAAQPVIAPIQTQPSILARPFAATPATNSSRNNQPDVFVPFDQDVPSLRFLPGILRPLMVSIYILLCLLMLAGLIFCGIWSRTHNGLWDYTTFGGSRYFVFQYLPVICGVILLLWLFQVQIAVQRVAPFIAMASFDSVARSEGPLMDVQPTNFLLPKLFYFRARQPIIGIAMIIFWLQIFTVPLLACLFNAYYHNLPGDGGWRWTTVQGIVWTLVVLYALLVIALVVLGLWIWGQRTGLKWDPRSLSDLISLLDRSNIIRDYEGSESFASPRDFRTRLEVRSDRLGYWTTSRRPNDVFYGIGEEGGVTRRYSIEGGKLREKSPPEGVSGFYPDTPTTPGPVMVDLEDTEEFEQMRTRYIPWYLSTTCVVLWIISGIILYLAFLIVSFVNDATINGFKPLLPVEATVSGFSATNFLYSFVPAVIAQLIFLCWLSVDYAFRRLQPYAAMSNITTPGAPAVDALLLDYPYRLPISVTISAMMARNIHVAWFSFVSLIAACFPILAGGCFWAQWYIPTQEVRVAVHPSAYYALCVFLAIFAFTLPLMLIGLRQRRLPHACTTLAEQISFLYGSHVLGEREWRAPLGSKTEMTGRLMAAATPQERQMGGGQFIFGRFVGKDGRTHLGIDRVGRESGTRSWRSKQASVPVTEPLPVARPAPRFRRTPSGRVVPVTPPDTDTNGTRYPYDEEKDVQTPPAPVSVRQVPQGEGFPSLPLAGAAVAAGGVAAAGAAGVAASRYDYGSQQDLITESQKAEYVRRKEGGTFGSPPTQSSGFATTSTAAATAAPVAAPVADTYDEDSPISPVEEADIADDYIYPRSETGKHYYGSQEGLIGESDKAEYVRRREGSSIRSRPTSEAYPPPLSAQEAAIMAGATAGIGIATSTPEDSAAQAPGATRDSTSIPSRTPSGRASASAAAQRAASGPATHSSGPSTDSAPPVPTISPSRSRARTISSSNIHTATTTTITNINLPAVPAVPATAAAAYPYGSAYGSMRDLTASDQAEYVRRREGGSFTAGSGVTRSAADAARRPVVGADGEDVGQDLGGGLREASAGQWSRDVIDEFDRT